MSSPSERPVIWIHLLILVMLKARAMLNTVSQYSGALLLISSLAQTNRRRTVESMFHTRWAHRFTVLVFLQDDCEEETLTAVVNRIVEVNKPAHTVHTLRIVRPPEE